MAKSVKNKQKLMTGKKLDKYLSHIYYSVNNPASYSSAYYILKEVKRRKAHSKISLGQIQKWLDKQKNYTEFKDVKRKFKRFKLFVSEKDMTWFVDTMNMGYLEQYNKPYKYILVAVDALSRFLRAVPLKTLKAVEMKSALAKIFRHNQPRNLFSDMGGEYKNHVVQSFLKGKGINYYYATNTSTKAFLAERKIRDMRAKIQKTLTHSTSRKWHNILPEIVDSLNKTYNRSIKASADYAYNKMTNWQLYNNQHEKSSNKPIVKSRKIPLRKNKNYRFKVNQRVKLALNKELFSRQIDKKFSNEVFTIIKRGLRDENKQYYIVKDNFNNIISGSFYPNELTSFNGVEKDSQLYEIERVLSKKKIGNKEFALVEWRGFDRQYNSFIPVSEIETLK